MAHAATSSFDVDPAAPDITEIRMPSKRVWNRAVRGPLAGCMVGIGLVAGCSGDVLDDGTDLGVSGSAETQADWVTPKAPTYSVLFPVKAPGMAEQEFKALGASFEQEGADTLVVNVSGSSVESIVAALTPSMGGVRKFIFDSDGSVESVETLGQVMQHLFGVRASGDSGAVAVIPLGDGAYGIIDVVLPARASASVSGKSLSSGSEPSNLATVLEL